MPVAHIDLVPSTLRRLSGVVSITPVADHGGKPCVGRWIRHLYLSACSVGMQSASSSSVVMPSSSSRPETHP
jgi:hypothetical protein